MQEYGKAYNKKGNKLNFKERYCQSRGHRGYMQVNCQLTCELCPPPELIIPQMSSVSSDNNDNGCLKEEVTYTNHGIIRSSRIITDKDVEYEYDYYGNDYSDEFETCASLDYYRVETLDGIYSTFDSYGSCKVIYLGMISFEVN